MRKCKSWIQSFVDYTSSTESPELCRKWAGIGTLAAALEQKVWVRTAYGATYPNLYIITVAPPGVGKTQSLSFSRRLLSELPEPFISPTSVNHATIVDQMKDSTRRFVDANMKHVEYNCLAVIVDEFGTLMAKYDDDMIAMLAHFYDVTPYGQRRRGNDLKIKIERPLLNLMVGSTPSVLMKFMPEGAWEQGFTSRVMFVYDDRKGFVDDFAEQNVKDSADLIHDLKEINDLQGQFGVTQEYADLVKLWREQDEEPKPTHPRLTYYNARRKVHLYKLSMIACVDSGGPLTIDRACFNTAIGWMHEIEDRMPLIFKASATVDNTAMEEIHYIVKQHYLQHKRWMPEHVLFREARKKIRATDVARTLDVMIQSGMLSVLDKNKPPGLRQFVALDESDSVDPGQALLQ